MNKYELITRNLAEIIGEDKLKAKLENNETITVYWGTAPTGKIHLGYFLPIMKIADFLKAGCYVTILLADIHAFLDNMKTELNLLKLKTNYYEKIIKEMLITLDVNIEKLEIIRGSSFQLNSEYTMDMYRLNSLIKVSDAKHASSEVVKINKDPNMAGLLYPTLQTLDEEYLGADIQFGGIDQRKIMMFAREYLPKLGYEKRIHLMCNMVPGLRRNIKNCNDNIIDKMSSTNINTKIDLLNEPDVIRNKINKVWCVEADINDNCLLDILKLLLWPLNNNQFVINRSEKYGGTIIYTDYTLLENDFLEKKLHPSDLKLGISDLIISLTNNIRNLFINDELKQMVNMAYPQE